ncbi:MAG: hypothetical protein APF84_12385 [Gracilibacter sp. BRH_c7a]|nr:MAG: hypothetical protein APF84_12385 [Gracilibacter sp. BRH_c7a]
MSKTKIYIDLGYVMKSNLYEQLKRLYKHYEIVIICIGSSENLSQEVLYIERKLPFIKDYILLNNDYFDINHFFINTKEGSVIKDQGDYDNFIKHLPIAI